MKPLKLEEITPEKIVELEEQAQNLRLMDLTVRQLEELSDQRQLAKMHLSSIENECQIRAMRARSLGFSKAELSRIFKVNSSTIKRWVG